MCLSSSVLRHMTCAMRLLLLAGGLRGPPKPISRRWPLRPPGTAMGPLPFVPAMAPLEAWWRRSREVRREICGVFEVKAALGAFSWCEKGA